MTDGFRADVPVIKQHSNQVQGFADRIKTAHSAAETTMDTNAFGIFGQFLAAHVLVQSDVVKSAIEGGGKAFEQVRTALDETAADYLATDQESGAILKEVNVDFG
ncbi:type VII secretion target [Saccharopolyspora flava]|uniref:Excreted virulence factor EspC, type VII ESX diderm n=1 Tax=Saccharopolyspora flava TaxID=95161 RepID=A0A1I6P5H0_9PSEU|nr:type VII secretion target [Saccharopolyspora flava]SFS35432.1 Excreted virulence factor EspC, type VII ESX diderm [Saccharopolyspora flava]